MPRTLALAGLLIDSWRDQSSPTEPNEMNLPGGTIPINRFGGTSDDGTAAPRLTGLIALAATEWEPR
jgi:hypothetical protein